MNRNHPFSSNPLFKPAINLLANVQLSNPLNPSSSKQKHQAQTHRRSLSIDDDIEDLQTRRRQSRQATPERLMAPGATLTPGGTHGSVELRDFSKSRSPSPYARSHLTQSDLEDEDSEFEPATSLRPLVREHEGAAGVRGWKRVLKGGLGNWLSGTWMGWQVLVSVLGFWVMGMAFGARLMDRFILWTGVYKFPYPVAVTFLHILITHVLLAGFCSLLRALARPLTNLGLGGIVPPSFPASAGGSGLKGRSKAPLIRWLRSGTGGIAGGGVLEFERKAVVQALPLAVVYMATRLLSNISFAYAVLPLYTLARIAIIPLTLILTSTLGQTSHSISTLSAALISTLNLLLASIVRGRVTWEPIVAGVFSSLFAALYPIILQKTHRNLIALLVPTSNDQDDPFASSDDNGKTSEATTRAYFQTLHYTSLLSLFFLFPILLLSGELPNMLHNCPFLDVPWFWFLMFCSSLFSLGLFLTTLLFVNMTSPLTMSFVGAPRSAFQLAVLVRRGLGVGNWVGVALCWVGNVWYFAIRRSEGREKGRRWLSGLE